MSDIDAILWRRQRLLERRVTTLEGQTSAPSVLLELPRTLRDWYELLESIRRFLIWVGPKLGLLWGLLQSLWPWLRDIGLPLVRTWLGF